MLNPIKTSNHGLGLIGAVFLIPLILASSGITVFPVSAHAAPPGRCEPWPECKNDDSDNGAQTLLGTLHFEPRDGLSGAGLLTDHGDDYFDYQKRINLPSCKNTAPGEWFIKAQRELVDGTQIWTANSGDLVADIVHSGQFNGCHGTTEISNGMLTLSLKKTGKRRKMTCWAKFEWQFDNEETANHSLEFFTLQSRGWIPLTTSPFDECDPKNLSSIEILGDFDFFSNVFDNGTTTSSYLETATLDFFVVFHFILGFWLVLKILIMLIH